MQTDFWKSHRRLLFSITAGICLGILAWVAGQISCLGRTANSGLAANMTFVQSPFYAGRIPLPDHGKNATPFALALNEGKLLVSYLNSDRIDEFDASFRLERTLWLNIDQASVTGIAIGGNRLYATDFHNGELAVVDYVTGRLVTTIDLLPDQQTHMRLFGVSVSAENLYVTDNCSNKVLAISGTPRPGVREAWELLRSFPSVPSDQFQLSFPGFSLITPDGRLLVSDIGSKQVKAFTCSGRPAHLLDQRAEARLSVPMGLAYDDVPSPELLTMADSSFNPSGVYSQGRIHVVDMKQAKVKVFDTLGKYIFTYGEGLREPTGIAIDTTRNTIFIADGGLHSVIMYKYED